MTADKDSGAAPSLKPRSVLPPTYFYVYAAGALLLHFFWPVHYVIEWPVTATGIPVGIVGIAVLVWADQLFKQAGTTVKPHEQPSVMITSGPFRFSRHPMYAGMTLSLVGLALLLGSVTPFLSPVAMTLTLELLFIPDEERSMTAVFGKQYEQYRKEVRRWL